MTPEVVEHAEFGACQLTLLGLRCRDCGGMHGWILVYQSPRPPRLDVISDVIGKTGGQFNHIADNVGIKYDSPERAIAAFGMLLDTLLQDAGVRKVADNSRGLN